MSKCFFDDALRTANGHLDCDLWVPPPTKWNLFKFKASAKPKSNVDLSHEYAKTSEWKGETEKKEDIVHKTTTNWNFSKGGRKYGVNLNSESMKGSVAGNMLKGDWVVDGNAMYENKFAKADWKAKACTTVVSPVLMDKMKIWTNADFETNKKSEQIIVMKQNIKWENFMFGWGFEHKGGDFTRQVAHLVNNFDSKSKSNYWGRVNMKEESVGLGCMVDHGKFTHSYEAEIGFGEGNSTTGVAGSPVQIVMGGEYDLNDKTNVDYTMRIAKEISYNQNVSHDLTDKCSMTLSQAFDSEKLSGKEPSYKLGFGFDYKI